MALEFPQIDPIALDLGIVQIRWYALAYLAGFLGGWRYCMHLAGKYNGQPPTRKHIDDFLPWVIIGVILGGRLGYVLFYNFDFYWDNPGEIYKVWRGGMAFHGGLLGVIAATILFCIKNKIEILKLSDLLACATPIGLFFGRIANFVNGELYGRVTDVSWAFIFPHGGEDPRHPSQLYQASLEGLALFIILFIFVNKTKALNYPGFLSGVFLVGYGVFRGFVEFFREPDEQLGFIIEGLTMGQILCLPMILLGIVLIVFSKQTQKALKT